MSGCRLAREFATAGITVLGFDIDENKVKILNAGRSIIKHVPHEQVRKLRKSGKFSATSDMSRIKEVDAVLICVPTPLTKNREPDMQYVVISSETIAKYLKKGQLIVLESTTYPGTTREVMVPILERRASRPDAISMWPFRPNEKTPAIKTIPQKQFPKSSAVLPKNAKTAQTPCIRRRSFAPCRFPPAK